MLTAIIRRHPHRAAFFSFVAAAALFCGWPVQASGAGQQEAGKQRAETPPAPSVVVTDDVGRQVEIPQPVLRIVSLAPSVTETIFALGAQDRLVGDTDFCDYPAEAKQKPKVGGAINPNLEQVVAMRPDLVVVTKSLNRRETVEALDRLHVPTYAMDARTVEEMIESMGRLATVIDAADQGKAQVASLQTRLDELHSKLEGVAPARVLFVVWTEPLISVGTETFLADALRLAGAESVIHSQQDWPHVSLEEVVRLQPDYLVFANSDTDRALEDFAALRQQPGWRDLKATQENRIAIVSDAINRPAPRLVDAIEQLARQLHPEVFAPQPVPALVPRTLKQRVGAAP
jgi:iron complex transport system substrate-binding protein